MKFKLILFSIFILLSSLSALTKAEVIKETIKCCKSQLASNRKDAIGLMLLHYLSKETTNNRDVVLMQAKIKRALDIQATEKGDLLKLSLLFEKVAAGYIRLKNYKKAAYYLAIAEKLNPLSDDALINQHLLGTKGYKVSSEELLGPYGDSKGKIKPPKTKLNDSGKSTKLATTRFIPGKLPVNTMTFKIEGHYYALILEKTTWKEAKEKAESLGGYLVCISTKAEHDFLVKTLKAKSNYWIGLTDEAKEGEFVWLNGDKLSFSNFTPNNPDNHGKKEHYVFSNPQGFWNDAKDNHGVSGYLVEWNK